MSEKIRMKGRMYSRKYSLSTTTYEFLARLRLVHQHHDSEVGQHRQTPGRTIYMCWRSLLRRAWLACLTSRWGTVGADKASGRRAAAGRPHARASTLPLRNRRDHPSRAPFPSFLFFLFFSFSAACSPQLPPFVTPALLKGSLELPGATPRHVPRPSFRTVRVTQAQGKMQARL